TRERDRFADSMPPRSGWFAACSSIMPSRSASVALPMFTPGIATTLLRRLTECKSTAAIGSLLTTGAHPLRACRLHLRLGGALHDPGPLCPREDPQVRPPRRCERRQQL